MIYIVSAENRHRFHHLLTEMHRQRKAVFIDQLKWRLEHNAGLEIDAYDSAAAIYLIEAGPDDGSVIASARLIPTSAPHLLGEQFAHLCESAPPRGANIWEATRFCPAPGTPAGAVRKAMLGRMIAAIMETALIFGIERVLYVTDAALGPLAAKAGWRASALGRSEGQGRAKLAAYVAEIDAVGLKRVRLQHNITAPLTRFAPGELERAA